MVKSHSAAFDSNSGGCQARLFQNILNHSRAFLVFFFLFICFLIQQKITLGHRTTMQTFVTSSVRSQDLKNATTKLDIL